MLLRKKDARVFYFNEEINPSLDEIIRMQGESRNFLNKIPNAFNKEIKKTIFYWGEMIA